MQHHFETSKYDEELWEKYLQIHSPFRCKQADRHNCSLRHNLPSRFHRSNNVVLLHNLKLKRCYTTQAPTPCKQCEEQGWLPADCLPMYYNAVNVETYIVTNALLANVNSRSRSLYAVIRLSVCLSSVCLSATFVRPIGGFNQRQIFLTLKFVVWAKLQNEEVLLHPFKTAKIIVFDPMKCKVQMCPYKTSY